MKTQDKINKTVYNIVVASIKDLLGTTIHNAVSSKSLKIDQAQLQGLLVLVNQTVDAGYHRCNQAFMRDLGSLLEDMPDEKASKSKKK